jgi:hypothetical protein
MEKLLSQLERAQEIALREVRRERGPSQTGVLACLHILSEAITNLKRSDNETPLTEAKEIIRRARETNRYLSSMGVSVIDRARISIMELLSLTDDVPNLIVWAEAFKALMDESGLTHWGMYREIECFLRKNADGDWTAIVQNKNKPPTREFLSKPSVRKISHGGVEAGMPEELLRNITDKMREHNAVLVKALRQTQAIVNEAFVESEAFIQFNDFEAIEPAGKPK